MMQELPETDEAPTIIAGSDDEILDGRTIIVGDAAMDEGTILVEREAGDGTIMVDRGVLDDGTVLVGGEGDEARTILVGRGANRPLDAPQPDEGPDAGTIVVGRPNASPGRRSPSRRGDKRRIALPPVEPGYTPLVVDAVGPGAVETYEPRAVSAPPVPVAPLDQGNEASRAYPAELLSVRGKARRRGAVTLLAFAGVCLLSVGGLTAIAVILLV